MWFQPRDNIIAPSSAACIQTCLGFVVLFFASAWPPLYRHNYHIAAVITAFSPLKQTFTWRLHCQGEFVDLWNNIWYMCALSEFRTSSKEQQHYALRVSGTGTMICSLIKTPNVLKPCKYPIIAHPMLDDEKVITLRHRDYLDWSKHYNKSSC